MDRYNKFITLGSLYSILNKVANERDICLTFEDVDDYEAYENGDLEVISQEQYNEILLEQTKLLDFLDNYYDGTGTEAAGGKR